MAVNNLPDFDDLQKAIEEIYKWNIRKSSLDIEIKNLEAGIVKEVTTNDKYFVLGKPPSMEKINSTYVYPGLSGELISKRLALAEAYASLEKARLCYEVLKTRIDVWRTQTANERASLL
jgi:hypothetical protein